MSIQLVFLVRPGETEWSLSGQRTGITDIPLTGYGRTLPRQLAPILAEVTFARILTSPLQRACGTCAFAGLGERAEIDYDLVEWNYGDHEGLTPQDIHVKAPSWMPFRDGCPGGEGPEDVGRRVDSVIERVRAVEGHVALFAHGHVFRVFVARWIGPASAGCHFLLETATLRDQAVERSGRCGKSPSSLAIAKSIEQRRAGTLTFGAPVGERIEGAMSTTDLGYKEKGTSTRRSSWRC
jgi:broad specificity phosphatase PhoE